MRRRALLAGAMSLSLPRSIDGAAQTVDPEFADAAVKLAGTGQFPAVFADAAHAALTDRFGSDTVGAMVQAVRAWDGVSDLPDPAERVAQCLLIMLYTGDIGGQAPRGDSPFYLWALAWQTLDFTQAPGTCGGAFGAWSQGQ